jgi:hypothetical protein
VRTIILIGIIACLCFSVGEGLRLTPFPVVALAESGSMNSQLKATASCQTSQRKYGPLDVPTRVQKPGKRQMVDYGNLPAQNGRELTANQGILPDTWELVGIFSLLFGSLTPGRAPPLIS